MPLTLTEIFDTAKKIKSEEGASLLVRAAVLDLFKQTDDTEEDLDKAVRQNLAYMAGYCGTDVRERIEKLFKCEHPVFGSIAEMGVPTSRESFMCGYYNVTLKELRAGDYKFPKLKENEESS